MLIDNSQHSTLISELYFAAKKLLNLGEDGTPVYVDDFCKMNEKVAALTDELYGMKGESDEEEARICVALLMGLSASIYGGTDKEEKLQEVLDRAFSVLGILDGSALKCELLLGCYGEIEDETLLDEAKEVIVRWDGRELKEEEKRMMEKWNEII